MLTLFKKSKDVAPPAEPAAATPQIDGRGAVQSMARQASTLGREAAEVRGLIIDAQSVSARQAKALLVLAQQLQQITHSQDGISVQTQDSRQAVSRARGRAVGRHRGVGHRRHAAPGVRRRRADRADRVADPARRLSVEAKRAGEAGRGFGVVADAVKDLAGKVESSSQDIMRTIGEMRASRRWRARSARSMATTSKGLSIARWPTSKAASRASTKRPSAAA